MQGFLIAAYKDQDNLLCLIKDLCSIGKVFVHINAKSNEVNVDELKKLENVIVEKKYKIEWGSYSHLEAILYMVNRMCQDPDIDYIHIISGQDVLVKDKQFFDTQIDLTKIYMSCCDVENTGVKNRYTHIHFLTNMDSRKRAWITFDKFVGRLQEILNFERKDICGLKLYKGMVWVSAPTDAFKYSVRFANTHRKFMIGVRHSIIPEEIFFQTVFMNSKYRGSVVNNHLRYIDWSFRNGSNPAYLDMTDYEKIIQSGCIFARKVDSKISKKLIESLENQRLLGA